MSNQWLRLWHDMPTDPKWRTISKASGQRIGDVMAVSQTSREAYHALDLTRKELQVMSAFTGPSSTYTRQSLAEAIGEPLGSVCGRVNALVKKGALATCGYQLNQPTRTRRELLSLPNGCRVWKAI